jgi:hypothetical protein
MTVKAMDAGKPYSPDDLRRALAAADDTAPVVGVELVAVPKDRWDELTAIRDLARDVVNSQREFHLASSSDQSRLEAKATYALATLAAALADRT